MTSSTNNQSAAKKVASVLRRVYVSPHFRAGLYVLFVAAFFAVSADAQVPGLDEIGQKLKDLAGGLTGNLVSGLAVIGVLIAGLLILSGKAEAVKLGVLVLIGAIVAKNAVSIGEWIVP